MTNTTKKNFILGIDTSNYKTSVAVVGSDGDIIADFRELLDVKKGERGLRQSDALFQHIDRLPVLLEKAFSQAKNAGLGKTEGGRLAAVAVSTRPRPQEGSYMPVFKAGIAAARSIGAAAGIPVYEFSHQEGHIEAALCGRAGGAETGAQARSGAAREPFIAYHLSGGTCEILKVTPIDTGICGYNIEIIGGSRDISFGQVIDRVGVQLGMAFPAGEEMDKLALSASQETKVLKKIGISDLYINLSGIDTQCRREAEKLGAGSPYTRTEAYTDEQAMLIRELFTRTAEALAALTENAACEYGINKFLFAGGVASSEYIKNYVKNALGGYGDGSLEIIFADPHLARDNAVGTALLGVKAYGNETR